MGADDLHANGDPVAIIEYHNGDPYATTESNARNSYYGITGYPTAWFDGSYDKVVGGSNTQSMYSSYKPKVDARMLIPTDFTVEIFGDNDGDEYHKPGECSGPGTRGRARKACRSYHHFRWSFFSEPDSIVFRHFV